MKKCEVCGADAHPPWKAHVFASKASNATATQVASNELETAVEPQARPGKPKQRWNREAYNAYQREYMKRRRAKLGK